MYLTMIIFQLKSVLMSPFLYVFSWIKNVYKKTKELKKRKEKEKGTRQGVVQWTKMGCFKQGRWASASPKLCCCWLCLERGKGSNLGSIVRFHGLLAHKPNMNVWLRQGKDHQIQLKSRVSLGFTSLSLSSALLTRVLLHRTGRSIGGPNNH